MAKKKSAKAVEPIEKFEDISVDEAEKNALESEFEPQIEEEKAEIPVFEEKKSDQFIYAQLKCINKMNNPAKARRLADRVLRNRKGE